VGARFGVGFTSVVNSRKRGEAFLSKDKKLAKRLKAAEIGL